jgi:hypothetical protein
MVLTENTQTENTQMENTQMENTQMANTQMENIILKANNKDKDKEEDLKDK